MDFVVAAATLRSVPIQNPTPNWWLWASALTCSLISLVGVKWSWLRINKQASSPKWQVPYHMDFVVAAAWREAGPSNHHDDKLDSDQ